MITTDQLAGEEQKRERHITDSARYRLNMAALNWAERQLKPPRNAPAACIAKERKLLGKN